MESLSYRLDKNIHFIEELFNEKERVFIYGAGKEATSLIRRLRIADLHPDGIIVSKNQDDYEDWAGIPLYEAPNVSLDAKNDAIIIAVRNRDVVEESLDNINVQWGGVTVHCEYMPSGRRSNVTGLVRKEKIASGKYFSSFTELDSIGEKQGTDKASGYADYLKKYEMFLSPWKNKKFNMIELGVLKGASIRMWGEYFTDAQVYGIDIDQACKQYEGDNRHVIIKDLGDEGAITSLKDIKPDIIVDDASHIWSHQVKALILLWDCLPHGGIYILEDIGTAFEGFKGLGYDDAVVSGYDFCSAIAEVATGYEHLRLTDKPAGVVMFRNEIEKIGSEIDMISFIFGSCIMIKR